MWSFLVTPEFQPFSIAALVMIGLFVIETVSSLFGASASALLDTVFGLHGVHIDLHHGGEAQGGNHAGGPGVAPSGGSHVSIGLFATVFDWLNAGRVPMLVLIMAAISSFAVGGMVLQIFAMHVAAPLPAMVAVMVGIAAAIPGTRWTSRLISWIIPRDESYALADDDLIGRVGIVTLGPVMEGAAARLKVQDKYGNWHFPRVAPGACGLSIPEGASALIVDRIDRVYTVIAAEGRLSATPE
jgi:hypothetical protein